jgi:hypothetical protein
MLRQCFGNASARLPAGQAGVPKGAIELFLHKRPCCFPVISLDRYLVIPW